MATRAVVTGLTRRRNSSFRRSITFVVLSVFFTAEGPARTQDWLSAEPSNY
jgi:hypothetical protein